MLQLVVMYRAGDSRIQFTLVGGGMILFFSLVVVLSSCFQCGQALQYVHQGR